ncbi:MAG: Gldg family protein [Deltaproteobacteria bacterium]|nr:Gldg family protein [Deltaproteobacteria bacterium]
MNKQPSGRHGEILGAAILAAGVVVVVGSVVVALPLFGPRPFAVLPLLLGALAVSAGAALQPKGGSLFSPRTLANSSKWALPLVVVGVGWALAHFADSRIDVTSARANTLAPESLQVAAAVDVDVRVVSFLAEDARASLELSTLLARYEAANPRVRAEPRSMKRAVDVDEARVLGVAALLPLGGPNVVVTAAGGRPVPIRFDAGLPTQEEQLTNALRAATTTKARVRAYVCAGHGEPELRDNGPLGLSRFREALDARGVELVALPLALSPIPEDARVLIVPPTTAPFSEAEGKALMAFVDAGGHLLLLLEPDAPNAAQQSLAGRFGVTILDDVLVDESPFSQMLGGADTATGSTQLGHAINRPLQGALTHFARATALTTSPMTGVDTIAVISTGSDAQAKKTNARGPLPLLIAADGKRQPIGRAVVVADTSFVQNAGINLGANRDLAINSALWLVQDESFITVRPRQKTGALIFLSPSSREALAFVLLFLIPVALAAAGAVLSSLRR